MQTKAFVRDNFSRFISCKDTIDSISILHIPLPSYLG